MAIAFSETTNNTGIVQQVRNLMRVDSTQWPTSRIVNSCNNYLDMLAGYAIGADSRFQWDDTNHSKLPIGTTNIVANQSDYSFLTDEQGNSIITLTRIDMVDTNGNYSQLQEIDQKDYEGWGLDQLQAQTGIPTFYDKIADNIIRLYPKPSTSVTAGLKFYFQRTPSYFAATDTTKSPGFSPLLHRGFVIASAYDGALTLGLSNLQGLGVERQIEEQKTRRYFADRNQDVDNIMTMSSIRFR
jgi:hypothetical protein